MVSKSYRIYLIPADFHILKELRETEKIQTDFRWLYLGRDIRILDNVRKILGGSLKEQSFGERLQEAARNSKDDYIEYIGTLASSNRSLFWWLTSISEKNPFVSRFFLYYCYVKLVLEDIRNDPCDCIIICETEGLARALQRNMKNIPAIVLVCRGFQRNAIRTSYRSTLAGLGRKIHFIVATTLRILLARILASIRDEKFTERIRIMIFSWADSRSLSSTSYTDIYCGTLGEEFRKRGERVAYLVHLLPTLSFIRGLTSLWRFRDEVILIEELLFPWDPLLASLLIWKNRQKPIGLQSLAGIDVTDIIQEELRTERATTAREKAFLNYFTGRNLVKRFSLSHFLHPFENHSWEKMFALSLKHHSPSTTIVGYLHSIAIPQYTCESISRWERKYGPHPDIILVNGSNAKSTLIQSGFDADTIFISGTFRSYSLAKTPGGQRNGVRNRILLPLSSDMEEALELIYLTLEATTDIPQISISIKYHPITRPGDLLRSLPRLPPHVHLTNEPIKNLLMDTTMVLYTSSTVAVEAVALGIPVIHVGSQLNIDRNIFEGFPEIPTASRPEDLRIAILKVLKEGNGMERERTGIIGKIFTHVDGTIIDKLAEGSLVRPSPLKDIDTRQSDIH